MNSHETLSVLEMGDNTWQLDNGLLRVTVSGQRGADIEGIEHLPRRSQILWEDPDAAFIPKRVAGDDSASFYDSYRGGIQELFPNAGPACTVFGAPLPFHGESNRVPWSIKGSKTENWVQLECQSELRRYPFSLAKRIRLLAGEATARVDSTVTNKSDQQLPVHWGFHPAFSSEVTAAPASLIGNFGHVQADKNRFGTQQAYPCGSEVPVTTVADRTVLQLVDGTAGSADLAYATSHDGWFVISSESTGLAAGLRWPVELFPQLWIWQECQDPSGYPWWGRNHIVGVEPHTSAPSQGLAMEMENNSCTWIHPGQSLGATFELFVADVGGDGLERFVQHVSSK